MPLAAWRMRDEYLRQPTTMRVRTLKKAPIARSGALWSAGRSPALPPLPNPAWWFPDHGAPQYTSLCHRHPIGAITRPRSLAHAQSGLDLHPVFSTLGHPVSIAPV